MRFAALRLGGCCRENAPDLVDLTHGRGYGRDSFVFLQFDPCMLQGAYSAREMRRSPRGESDRQRQKQDTNRRHRGKRLPDRCIQHGSWHGDRSEPIRVGGASIGGNDIEVQQVPAPPKATPPHSMRYPIGGCLFPDKCLWVNRARPNRPFRVDNGGKPSLVQAHAAEHGLQSFDPYADGEQIDDLAFSQDRHNHRGEQALLQRTHDDVRYGGPFFLKHLPVESSNCGIRQRQCRSPGCRSIKELSRLTRSPHDDRHAKCFGNSPRRAVECLQITSSQILGGSQCFHHQTWPGQFTVDRSRQFMCQCLRPLDSPRLLGPYIRPGGQGSEQQDREHESRREDQKEGRCRPFPP